MPIIDHRGQNEKGIYPIEMFKFDQDRDGFICPEGKFLKYWGKHKHSRQYVYRAKTKDCKICIKKAECTRDRARSLSYHIYEESIEKARQLNKTKGYRVSQRMRKRIEELFGEAKELMGLRRTKFRRLKFIKEQVLMTATAQNIKRMVKFFSKQPRKAENIAIQPLLLQIWDNLSRIFVFLLYNKREWLCVIPMQI